MSMFLPPSVIKSGFDIICAIKIQYDESSCFGMGFFVSDRIIMTSARPIFEKDKVTISVRKFNEEEIFKVEKLGTEHEQGTTFLAVPREYKSSTYGTLAQDGTLMYRDKIFTFANAPGVSETFLNGYVCMNCVDVPQQDWGTDQCKDYYYYIGKEKLGRSLGCFWNEISLRNCTTENEREFKGNLRSGLPVIECRGFRFGTNCEGCPVINKNGEVVGMFIGGPTVPIALHVSVLRPLLALALQQLQEYEAGDASH